MGENRIVPVINKVGTTEYKVQLSITDFFFQKIVNIIFSLI